MAAAAGWLAVCVRPEREKDPASEAFHFIFCPGVLHAARPIMDQIAPRIRTYPRERREARETRRFKSDSQHHFLGPGRRACTKRCLMVHRRKTLGSRERPFQFHSSIRRTEYFNPRLEVGHAA